MCPTILRIYLTATPGAAVLSWYGILRTYNSVHGTPSIVYSEARADCLSQGFRPSLREDLIPTYFGRYCVGAIFRVSPPGLAIYGLAFGKYTNSDLGERPSQLQSRRIRNHQLHFNNHVGTAGCWTTGSSWITVGTRTESSAETNRFDQDACGFTPLSLRSSSSILV